MGSSEKTHPLARQNAASRGWPRCWANARGSAAAIVLLIGLVVIGLVGPASADDVLNPQALVHVSDKYQSSGALPQGAGVLDRARPEYDAAGLVLDDFILFPTFALGLSSDDNIYRSPGATVGDVFWTFSPRLD